MNVKSAKEKKIDSVEVFKNNLPPTFPGVEVGLWETFSMSRWGKLPPAQEQSL